MTYLFIKSYLIANIQLIMEFNLKFNINSYMVIHKKSDNMVKCDVFMYYLTLLIKILIDYLFNDQITS